MPREKTPQPGERPEEKPEAPKAEAKEEIEVKEEILRPWEEIEREEEKRLIEQYIEPVQLDKKSQEFVSEVLRREVEDKRIEFVKKWFEENKEDLEARGLSTEVSEQKKVAIALESGALEQLKTREEYKDDYQNIENLNALRLDLGKNHIPIESQFLLLNFLDKKRELLEREIQEMEKQGRSATELSIKEKELDRLFNEELLLAQKISGRNLAAETAEEVESEIEPREQYIEGQLGERITEARNTQKVDLFREKWAKLSEQQREKVFGNNPTGFADWRIAALLSRPDFKRLNLDKEGYLALVAAGYSPENFKTKGILRNKIQVKEGEVISKQELPQFIQDTKEEFAKQIERRAREELGEEWDKEYVRLSREHAEEKMKELAGSPEKAIEGIEGVYGTVKDRLIAEWMERDLKKEPKTREQLEATRKEFASKGINPTEFIQDVLSRKGPLEKLTGNLEQDKTSIGKFLHDRGIRLNKEVWEKLDKKLVDPERYKKEQKKKKGFLTWLLELISALFILAAEEAVKEKPRSAKETQK